MNVPDIIDNIETHLLQAFELEDKAMKETGKAQTRIILKANSHRVKAERSIEKLRYILGYD